MPKLLITVDTETFEEAVTNELEAREVVGRIMQFGYCRTGEGSGFVGYPPHRIVLVEYTEK